MSSTEQVKEIVESFVANELASLDRFGDQPATFSLSPDLADPRQDLSHSEPIGLPKKTGGAPPNEAKTGPKLLNNRSLPTSNPHTAASSAASLALSAKTSSSAHSAVPGPENGPTAPEAAETHRPAQPAHPQGPRRLPSTREPDQLRKVSSGSTASVSASEREKRMSLGDRFLKFGKRIASGSKK